MDVPIPETIIVSTANMTVTTFEFGKVEFVALGIFQRVFQEISEDTNEVSEIGAWLDKLNPKAEAMNHKYTEENPQ